jgi:hypothetical protein
MKLSEKTIDVLNNFKTIQPNMVFNEGNVLATMADAKNILSSVELEDKFESKFGIYDLNEFLATLDLVDSPNIDLKKDHAVISAQSGRSKVKYYFSDPDMLVHPTKDIKMPSTEVSFVLDVGTLGKLKKAAATLGHDFLFIKPSDGVLELSVTDPENSTSNVFTLEVPGEFEGAFSFVLNLNNLKLMNVDYDVEISKKLISQFTSKETDLPIKYWIALEKTSTYEG